MPKRGLFLRAPKWIETAPSSLADSPRRTGKPSRMEVLGLCSRWTGGEPGYFSTRIVSFGCAMDHLSTKRSQQDKPVDCGSGALEPGPFVVPPIILPQERVIQRSLSTTYFCPAETYQCRGLPLFNKAEPPSRHQGHSRASRTRGTRRQAPFG